MGLFGIEFQLICRVKLPGDWLIEIIDILIEIIYIDILILIEIIADGMFYFILF